ncbi:MAG TPA: hypothetical protein VFK03_02900, partial [Candidatus Saccharimonadales bacterium]|nr:hypothetical protein [Candidatus Saccharimonadales bacterium]
GKDTFIAKFSSSGTLEWDKTWGGADNDYSRTIIQTNDGKYAIAGYTLSFGAGGADVFLVKFNETGSVEWAKSFGSTADDTSQSLSQTSDNGYLVGGYTLGYGAGGNDLLLVKYDDNGGISGCPSSMCGDISATANDLAASYSARTVTSSNPTAGVTDPGLTVTSPTPTTTVIVAPVLLEMPIGAQLAATSTPATAPDEGTIFRLRLDIHTYNGQADSGTLQLKLQYAPKGGAATCSTVPSGNFDDITDSSDGIRWADNTNAVSGMGVALNSEDPIHGSDTPNIDQTYQEKGTTTFTNSNAIPAGQDGMWDFGLVAYHAFQNTTYCFRVVNDDGSLIDNYTQYPELDIPPATLTQASFRWYNPEPSGSSTTFIKDYGNTKNETANDIAPTDDGGYVTTGYTDTSGDTVGNKDVTLAKYNAAGDLEWANSWGGSYFDEGNAVTQTSDGGYAVTGEYDSGHQTKDCRLSPCTIISYPSRMFLNKYNSSGNLQWTRIWGTRGSSCTDLCQDYASGRSLTQTSDGGYAITGATSGFYDSGGAGGGGGGGGDEMFIVKYDSAGGLLWDRTWGGSGDDAGTSIVEVSDGYNVLTSASSCGLDSSCMALVKFNINGGVVWDEAFGETVSLSSAATVYFNPSSMVATSDGGYAVSGSY